MLDESRFEASIGMSRKWDAREAGKEVAREVIQKLSSPPSFFLLFSTIHYEKHGGFEELLNGVYDALPENTPLIGGTVTGFICNKGCHTRGVVAVAINGEGIDIAAGYAKNVKRNPFFAGKKVATDISRKLSKSKKENKLLIECISGPLEPSILSHDKTQSFIKILPNKLVHRIRDVLFEISVRLLHYGQGMEEDVLNAMAEILKDYSIIGLSTFDDLKDISHYQFYNNNVLNDAVVAIGICVDNDIVLERTPPNVTHSGKMLNIELGWRNKCFNEINGHPAASQYIKEMGWPEEYIKPHIKDIFHKTFYFPLGYEHEGILYAFPVGLFFGETISTNQVIRENQVEILYTSTKKFFESFENYLEQMSNKKILFSLFVDVGTVPGMIGNKLYHMKDMIDQRNTSAPYLILFSCGEHSKKLNKKPVFNNYGRVALSILDKKLVTTHG